MFCFRFKCHSKFENNSKVIMPTTARLALVIDGTHYTQLCCAPTPWIRHLDLAKLWKPFLDECQGSVLSGTTSTWSTIPQTVCLHNKWLSKVPFWSGKPPSCVKQAEITNMWTYDRTKHFQSLKKNEPGTSSIWLFVVLFFCFFIPCNRELQKRRLNPSASLAGRGPERCITYTT